MKKTLFFDIETDGLGGDFLAGGVFNAESQEYFYFESMNKLTSFLMRKEFYKFKIYSHYGGKYDMIYFIEEITKRFNADITGLIFQGSRILKFNIKNRIFLDSFSLLPMSLLKLEKAFDVKRSTAEVKDCRDNLKSFMKTNYKLFKQYLKEDVINLYLIMKKFKALPYICDCEAITTASQALKVYKKFFSPKIHNDSSGEEFIRNAYYGGRCEIFKDYGENLFYYDFNSLYPSVMKNNKFPITKPIYTLEYKKNYLGIYKVKVNIKKNTYLTNIPFRDLQNKKLLFPVGCFETYLTSVEIEECKKDGILLNIIEGYYFEKDDFIFSEYVDTFTELKTTAKNENNEGLYLLSKLLLNSLYGKFGQRRECKEYFILDKLKNFDDIYPVNEDLGIFAKDTINESKDIKPSIAVFVTAYARLELYRVMKGLIKNGNEIFYCDTDSIITNADIKTMDELKITVSETILGALKLENEIKKAVFILPKVYGLINQDNKEVIHVKGFQDSFTFNDLLKHKNKTKIISEKRKSLGGLKTNIRRAKKIRECFTMEKQINSEYDKRKIIKNNSTPVYIYN